MGNLREDLQLSILGASKEIEGASELVKKLIETRGSNSDFLLIHSQVGVPDDLETEVLIGTPNYGTWNKIFGFNLNTRKEEKDRYLHIRGDTVSVVSCESPVPFKELKRRHPDEYHVKQVRDYIPLTKIINQLPKEMLLALDVIGHKTVSYAIGGTTLKLVQQL